MEKRVNIEQTQPEAWSALSNLAGILNKSSLTPIQRHLITVRTSQINSCAYCLNMHTKEALKSGETQQRLFLLSAWREAGIFTEEEKAILLLTEEITLISQHGVSDTTYTLATALFSAEKISEIMMLIILMNAWNRIAVSTHKPIG